MDYLNDLDAMLDEVAARYNTLLLRAGDSAQILDGTPQRRVLAVQEYARPSFGADYALQVKGDEGDDGGLDHAGMGWRLEGKTNDPRRAARFWLFGD